MIEYQIRFPFQLEWVTWQGMNEAQLTYCKRAGIGVRMRVVSEWEVLNEV